MRKFGDYFYFCTDHLIEVNLKNTVSYWLQCLPRVVSRNAVQFLCKYMLDRVKIVKPPKLQTLQDEPSLGVNEINYQ
jgi:hypothetical protein